jgi:RNA polymerase sigma-70 factor (ECF subfamily)
MRVAIQHRPATASIGLIEVSMKQVDPSLESIARERHDQFVQAHMKRVFLLIYRIVGNVADAQDLTQEAFIKALSREEQLKDLEKAAHWLSRIATNTALDHLRRNGRVHFTELDEMPERMHVSHAPSAESEVLREERRLLLEAGLAVLTPRERAALLLRDVDEMSAEDVAAHLNCSKATVRSHIANARGKFKKFLERHRKGSVI